MVSQSGKIVSTINEASILFHGESKSFLRLTKGVYFFSKRRSNEFRSDVPSIRNFRNTRFFCNLFIYFSINGNRCRIDPFNLGEIFCLRRLIVANIVPLRSPRYVCVSSRKVSKLFSILPSLLLLLKSSNIVIHISSTWNASSLVPG